MKKLFLIVTISAMSLCLMLFQNMTPAPSVAEFGFTTHFFPGYQESKLTEAQLLSTIDALAQKNVKWIRLPIEMTVKKFYSSQNIEFSEEQLKPYIRLYSYAKSKGLKVFASTVPCYEFNKLSLSSLEKAKAIRYFTFI